MPEMDSVNNPQGSHEKTLAEAAAWVVKSGAAGFGQKERIELDHWRAQSPDHDAAYRDALATWERALLLSAADLADDDAPRPSSDEMRAEGFDIVIAGGAMRRPPLWRGLAAALALFLLVGAFVYAYDPLVALRADHATATGEIERIRMSDGSEIVLNTRSAVQVGFQDDMRIVALLKGEAMFSVAPDANRPFTVRANNVEVRALGTQFVVREQGGGAKVTALEHHVEVAVAAKDGPPPKKVVLTPVQSVRVSDAGTVSAVTQENPADVAAWSRGRLVFRKRPLGDVLDEIDRYTGGRTIVMNDALAQQSVSGVFFLDQLDAARRRVADELQAEHLQVLPGVVVLY